MQINRKALIATTLAAPTLLVLAVAPGAASAHGTMSNPPSRTMVCYSEGPESPRSAACKQAVATGGTQPLYDWNEVNIADAAGRHRQIIPDGKLCSAGRDKYRGFDQARADWPATTMASGATHTFKYRATAPHKGAFELYITDESYDPAKPLTWSDLESTPFHTVTNPTVAEGYYTMTAKLPSRQGRHLIYAIWQRSDSPEAFYSCSDVVFGQSNPSPAPTPTGTPTATPKPTPTTSTPKPTSTTSSPKPTSTTTPSGRQRPGRDQRGRRRRPRHRDRGRTGEGDGRLQRLPGARRHLRRLHPGQEPARHAHRGLDAEPEGGQGRHPRRDRALQGRQRGADLDHRRLIGKCRLSLSWKLSRLLASRTGGARRKTGDRWGAVAPWRVLGARFHRKRGRDTAMPVDLNNERPLAWDSATLDADTKAMLDNLQPNILRAHVREHLSVLFVRFNDVAEGRAFLRWVATTKMKSARKHMQEVRDFAAGRHRGTPYVGIGISKAGYRDLGHSVEDVREFGDPVFRDGMKRRVAEVDDPPVEEWDRAFQREIHAVILIGDAEAEPVERLREEILGELPDSARLLGEERGQGMRNPAGDGIEHFGYVDGRSQPLFLKDEVDREPKEHWDPAFPLSNVLVPDPFAPNPVRHHGSYLVFRKLEQNVRAFKEIERDLADTLGLAGVDRERAGAMLVGRFKDGTP
ncbi:lytic polysaccharide monooxygenase [Nonomuraea thailandensis]